MFLMRLFRVVSTQTCFVYPHRNHGAVGHWLKLLRPLLPNQDTLPKGGLGNLIALPLQKQSGKGK
jgi:hypothetical protein